MDIRSGFAPDDKCQCQRFQPPSVRVHNVQGLHDALGCRLAVISRPISDRIEIFRAPVRVVPLLFDLLLLCRQFGRAQNNRRFQIAVVGIEFLPQVKRFYGRLTVRIKSWASNGLMMNL